MQQGQKKIYVLGKCLKCKEKQKFSGKKKKKKYSGYSPKPWDFAIWFQEAVISCITQMPPLKQRQKKAKK